MNSPHHSTAGFASPPDVNPTAVFCPLLVLSCLRIFTPSLTLDPGRTASALFAGFLTSLLIQWIVDVVRHPES